MTAWQAFLAFWDETHKRDVDKHIVAGIVLGATLWLLNWTMDFAWSSVRSDTGVAAIVAAVWLPWSPFATYAVKYWFDRKDEAA